MSPRHCRLILIALAAASAGCALMSRGQPSERYLVTDSAIDVAMGMRLCVAVDRADKHGIWWWGRGATGCDSRSTGPDLFHPADASVVRSADSTILSFRVATHSDTRPFVDVRLKVDGNYMRSEETGAQVSLQRRTTLDVPLVPPRGR
jgi:hypothetical protein